MLKEGFFRYAMDARCQRADAARLLSDLSLHAELHPLIVRVQPLPADGGALRSYAITDRLSWGPLRFPITYRADVLAATSEEVVTVARQWPRTTVRNHSRLGQHDEGSVRIEVEIGLCAPAPLFAYAFRQARSAHRELATRLRAALERG